MNVIQRFRARQRDMKTLSSVMSDSLERAQRSGDEYAGAHHLVLAALAMEDGTASELLADFGASAEAFAEAVAAQHGEALRELGISDELVDVSAVPIEPGTGKYGKADATYEQAIKHIYEVHNAGDDHRQLISAYVLAGAARVDRGVAARAFASLGIDVDALIERATGV